MSDRFFGYGSLVNTATHVYEQVEPATVQGWRRHWVPSSIRPVSFLSVFEDPTSQIAGVTASVGSAGWQALDVREAAYDRLLLPEPHSGVAIYRAAADRLGDPEAGQPILLSYVDVVVQGFFRLYGEQGVEGFFETTSGWDTPVLDDRDDPIYPRAQQLGADEKAMTRAYLEDVGAQVVRRT